MIQGMVTRLSDRLANEGGSAAEWARLVRALTVLGERERAASILEEARIVFQADKAGLEILNAAARNAGLGE